MGHILDRCDMLDVHDRIPVADISFCGPAEQPEPSYRGKHLSPRHDG